MVEVVGIVAAVVLGGWLVEMGRRALLGTRLQRSMAVSPTPVTSGGGMGAGSQP